MNKSEHQNDENSVTVMVSYCSTHEAWQFILSLFMSWVSLSVLLGTWDSVHHLQLNESAQAYSLAVCVLMGIGRVALVKSTCFMSESEEKDNNGLVNSDKFTRFSAPSGSRSRCKTAASRTNLRSFCRTVGYLTFFISRGHHLANARF